MSREYEKSGFIYSMELEVEPQCIFKTFSLPMWFKTCQLFSKHSWLHPFAYTGEKLVYQGGQSDLVNVTCQSLGI